MAGKNIGNGLSGGLSLHRKTRSGSGCRMPNKWKKKLKFKKMKTLEELLQGLGCVGDAFDSTGEFTEAGDKAYRFLLDLLYDIEGLTGESVSSIVKELDGICNENY